MQRFRISQCTLHFAAELYYAFTRIRDIRFLFRAIIIGIVAIIKYCLLGHRMALDIRYGDDSPISVADMNEVRRVVHKNMVFSTWQKGDIMCIDNFSTSHGRQPTYDYGRKILVAWSNPHDKTSTLPSADTNESKQLNEDLKKSCSLLFDDTCVPGAAEVTPNSSPESTLSTDEAHDLRTSFIMNQDKEEAVTKVLHKRHMLCPSQSLKNIFT